MAIKIPDLNRAQQAIGYNFVDKKLLLTALTHPSASSQEPDLPHYQRMEFLGDAVLQYLASTVLYDLNPDADEGELTRMRAACVSEKPLAAAAEKLGLNEFFVLSTGMDRRNGRKLTSIACDIYESVLAAIYLDGGLEPAREYVEKGLGDFLRNPPEKRTDAKTALQEELQKNGEVQIRYRELGFDGPPHDRTFFMELVVDGESVAKGEGRSKHAAQQAAALKYLNEIQNSGKE